VAKKKPYQRAERQRQAQRQAELEAHRRQRTIVAITAALSVLVVIGVVVLLAVRGGDTDPAAAQPTDTPSASTPTTPGAPDKPASIPTKIAAAPKRPTALPASVDCTYKKSAEAAAKKVNPPANGKVTSSGTQAVLLDTTAGKIKLRLDKALAPCAVNSFVSLAEQKYFDNTSCHRMTTGAGLQVLQCGDPGGTGSGGPGYSFADEVWPTLKYGRGVLAMANSGPNTNGSQFFIVYGEASVLEPKYTAFGTVDAASLAVIDKVAKAGVTSQQPGSGDGKPVMQVTIKTATAS
jgi:peptidyl-prolyl cis-trans isomerase B (cyclophilin B)